MVVHRFWCSSCGIFHKGVDQMTAKELIAKLSLTPDAEIELGMMGHISRASSIIIFYSGTQEGNPGSVLIQAEPDQYHGMIVEHSRWR